MNEAKGLLSRQLYTQTTQDDRDREEADKKTYRDKIQQQKQQQPSLCVGLEKVKYHNFQEAKGSVLFSRESNLIKRKN